MERLQVLNRIRIIGMIISIVLVVGSALGVTTAYYHVKSNAVVNQFSLGNITTELVEDFYQDKKTDTMTEFVKTPQVNNTGADACLVRVRVGITPENVVDKEVTIGNKKKPYLQIMDENGNNWIYNNTWSNDWWEYRDGWYYYKGVLNPGESTETLFSSVVVNYAQDSDWEDFDIVLYHESVQAELIHNGVTVTDSAKIWDIYDKAGL